MKKMRLEQVIDNRGPFMLKENVGIPSPNPSFYTWGNRDPEKLSELPKATQLVSKQKQNANEVSVSQHCTG